MNDEGPGPAHAMSQCSVGLTHFEYYVSTQTAVARQGVPGWHRSQKYRDVIFV